MRSRGSAPLRSKDDRERRGCRSVSQDAGFNSSRWKQAINPLVLVVVPWSMVLALCRFHVVFLLLKPACDQCSKRCPGALLRGVPDCPSPVVARSAQTLSNGEEEGKIPSQAVINPIVCFFFCSYRHGPSIVSLWLAQRLCWERRKVAAPLCVAWLLLGCDYCLA